MKRKIGAQFIQVLLLINFQAFAQPTPTPYPITKPAELTEWFCYSVVDGDTIKIERNGVKETVRLLAVDTPETVHPTKKVEYYGPEASAFTKDMLTGQKVWIEYEKTKLDRYGRTLAYVWLEDGTLFNLTLIEEGYARVYDGAKGLKYKDAVLEQLLVAQTSQQGLWAVESTPSPVPTRRPAKTTPKPTAQPTVKPTIQPTAKPTEKPTAQPTAIPQTPAPPTPQPTKQARIVYFTPGGGVYHFSKSCRTLANSDVINSSSLDSVPAQYTRACKVCGK